MASEGVENEAQLAWLRSEGVANMRGYVFSKPMRGDEFREQLEGSDPPWLDVVPA
ncbi:MAG: hypothetical protein QF570_02640 [Myxococcota bacterium]|jgi:EAL domain-containing protein (putative c-di-GMP-specific phosphodiesterase class I)|nr:hypothetical protein [Myxococcota bacterium]